MLPKNKKNILKLLKSLKKPYMLSLILRFYILCWQSAILKWKSMIKPFDCVKKVLNI